MPVGPVEGLPWYPKKQYEETKTGHFVCIVSVALFLGMASRFRLLCVEVLLLSV